MKGKLLVVDDDANLRESLKDNLDMDGYHVTMAASGQEALKAVVTDFYDVILMDFNLTDATGIDVIRQIRKINTQSQILMMTAHASLDTAIQAIQESVDNFLVKPVDVGQLKLAISKCLEKLRLEQENQRLIAELKKANEQLLNLSNMKSKFMSMASHDLSNSLMTLQVSFELLSSSMKPTQEQSKRITYISNGIAQISRLIEDLVDWASIEQGKFRLEKADLSISKLIEEIVGGFQGKAAQRSLVLKSDVASGLPSVFADKRRIAQVLANLLENAMRHTSAEGVITVRAKTAGNGQIEVAVQDTGDGIAPTELTRIFESFYQSEGTKPDSARGRLGLGLSISREIIAGHNGTIWVESEGLGKGATFYFSLPASPKK